MNARGDLLHATAAKLKHWAANTWFDVPAEERATYLSNLEELSRSQLDYILCSHQWFSRCTMAKAHSECPLVSDHHPVVADFK